ncbi:MAG: endonuclease V, partial [Bacteroidota bacterium]
NIFRVVVNEIAPYESGSFYKRELPCLLRLLEEVESYSTTIIIDGYCWLSDETQKGLGAYLYETLEGQIPVIGVAKNAFKNSQVAQPLYRGESQKPLYVTAVGMPLDEAVKNIEQMHGEYRLPTLLKAVDRLAREMV